MEYMRINAINDKWTLSKLISNGSTANVFLAKENYTEAKVALKVFDSMEETSRREAELLNGLDHPRIIKVTHHTVLDSDEARAYLPEHQQLSVIAMEYAAKGDLLSLIEAFGRFPEMVARSYFKQLLDAIEYLHAQGIAHEDIKPENILIDAEFNLKLADFGTAGRFSQDASKTGVLGTPLYFCPEKHLETEYNPFKADLFSLGMVLFIMVTGNLPFEAATEEDCLYNLIIEGKFDEFWKTHEQLKEAQDGHLPKGMFKESFKSLLNRLFNYDPCERLTINEIKQSEWVRGLSLEDKKLTDFVSQIASKMQYMAN